jgi:hypothetical protein
MFVTRRRNCVVRVLSASSLTTVFLTVTYCYVQDRLQVCAGVAHTVAHHPDTTSQGSIVILFDLYQSINLFIITSCTLLLYGISALPPYETFESSIAFALSYSCLVS